MKFSTRCDAELAAAALFDTISDFERTERILQRRGVAVQRLEPGQRAGQGQGQGWHLGFDWRGQRRELQLHLQQFERPERIGLAGGSENYDIAVDMSVVSLGRQRSRLIFETDIRPRNMRSRLMLQTLKLGKAQLQRKYGERIGLYLQQMLVAA